MDHRLPRMSGLLLHPTSLPGPFGIGDLGPAADAFIDFLVASGQRWWQVLPLGPTGFGHSPYQSPSTHAGNPLLISPERLQDDGLLTAADLQDRPGGTEDRVDYDAVYQFKGRLLRTAFQRFDRRDRAYRDFCRREAAWLSEFALFTALKTAHGDLIWTEWPPDLAARRPHALARARKALEEEIHFAQFVQFFFDRQWGRLRDRAHAHGLRLIGDVPIFVAHDSADVWARPDLFELDPQGRPTVVAGVPPDYFSATGQLWGNPLYRWPAHVAEQFAWWAERLRAALRQVDLVRLDHFRAFAAYWEVPADAPTAETGRWVDVPGAAFLDAMRTALGGLPLIAEDLGLITPDVEALRDQFTLPGMRVLQFAFVPGENQDRPFRYPNHCAVYTGTHDNDTSVGWFHTHDDDDDAAESIAAERDIVRRYLHTDGAEIHWDLIRLALSSVADTAIMPVQDLLGLDSRGRMNTPGVTGGNWAWRLRADELTPDLAQRLGELTRLYGRWNPDLPASEPTAVPPGQDVRLTEPATMGADATTDDGAAINTTTNSTATAASTATAMAKANTADQLDPLGPTARPC